MKIENRELHTLKPYEFNNRRHPEKQIERIAKSIKEFGFTQPLVIDENSEIIAGHGRYYAAAHLNLMQVPCVQLSDLTEDQIRAYRILDNKLQNDSEWDFDNLNLELDWLEDNKWDLPEWGLDELRFDTEEDPEVTEDDFQEQDQTEIYIKRGDLIELGRHRVLCGDSTSCVDMDYAAFVDVDICFTSPPYNAGDNKLGGNKNKIDSKYENDSDARSTDEYVQFLIDVTSECISRCRMTAINLQMLAGNKIALQEFYYHFREHLADRAIWYKGHGQPAAAAHVLNSRYEEITFFSNETMPNRALPFANFHGNISNVYEGSGNSSNEFSRVHAATFPIHLAAWVLGLFVKANTVLDPFLGSGTTLIACEQLNRTCYGIEIEPKYCQVIIDRFRKYCADNNKEAQIKINGEPIENKWLDEMAGNNAKETKAEQRATA